MATEQCLPPAEAKEDSMVLSSLWEDSAVGGQVSGWIKTLWISVSAGHGPDKISRIGRYWTTLVSLTNHILKTTMHPVFCIQHMRPRILFDAPLGI